MGFFKQKFRSIKKFPDWLYWFPALLLKGLLRCCYRVRVEDPHGFLTTARGCVSVTWHNRLLFFPVVCPAPVRKRTLAVVSASRDGQYIVDLIRKFGIRSLRGSSSRHGARVEREAIRAIREENCNVSFTPDGPRGPKYRLKPGPVHLAAVTGAPVVPLSINASRYWQLRSWDNFQIPKPFSRLTLVLGDPIQVAANPSPEELEEARLRIEQALLQITVD